MSIDSYRIFDTTDYAKTIYFYTSLGVAVIPTSMVYRIDDITSGLETEILDDTTVYPSGTSYTIDVSSALNGLVSASHNLEKRLITIEYFYGGSARNVTYDSYEIQKRLGTVFTASSFTYDPTATSDYGDDLNAAIAAIGSVPTTLYIDGVASLTANLVVPANVHVIDTKEGHILQTGAFTLAINGPFTGYKDVAFSGFSTGQVTFGNGIEWVLPEWWGTGSAAAQSAQDSIAATGGVLRFGPGTYLCNFILDSNVWLKGSGVEITKLKSVSGSDADVIKGRSFATLTGTSKATPETRGIRYSKITDMTIDGDKDNNTSGFGIRLWGCSLQFDNLLVQNCAEDGIWTEFTTHDTPTGPDWQDNMLESFYNNIKTVGNDGNGWTYKGPHDGHINNFVTAHNGGWGFQGLTAYSSVRGGNWNAWTNTSGSFTFTSGAILQGITSSGTGGVGVQTLAGALNISNLYAGGHAIGLDLTGNSNVIQGLVRSSTTHGLQVTAMTASKLDLYMAGNANNLNIVSESGINMYNILISLASAETRGALPTSSPYWIQVSGTAYESNFNFPQRTDFTAGGYSPDFPESDGVLATVP